MNRFWRGLAIKEARRSYWSQRHPLASGLLGAMPGSLMAAVLLQIIDGWDWLVFVLLFVGFTVAYAAIDRLLTRWARRNRPDYFHKDARAAED